MPPVKLQIQTTLARSIRGLVNVGNTCFINSAIQALFSAKCFREFLNVERQGEGRVLLPMMKTLFQEIEQRNTNPVKPQHIVEFSWTTLKYPRGIESSTSQYFSSVLETLASETGKDPMDMTFRKTSTCSIHNIAGSTSIESIRCLTMNVCYGTSVKAAYHKALSCTGGFCCDEEKSHIDFVKIPGAVSIEIDYLKVNELGQCVRDPRRLIISHEISMSVAGKAVPYMLTSVIVYCERFGGRHYYCITRLEKNNWLKCDDSNVRPFASHPTPNFPDFPCLLIYEPSKS